VKDITYSEKGRKTLTRRFLERGKGRKIGSVETSTEKIKAYNMRRESEHRSNRVGGGDLPMSTIEGQIWVRNKGALSSRRNERAVASRSLRCRARYSWRNGRKSSGGLV